MAINARNVKNVGGGKKHPPLDPGTYPARLVQVIDLGLQPQQPFQGQEKPPANELMLTYEFLDEFLKDEDGEDDPKKPRWYSETMPLHSLEADKAKSTKRYYAIDPNEDHEGDWAKMLGTPCMVTLVHKPRKGDPDNPYVNIAAVSSMRPKEAAKAPVLVNEPKAFDLDTPDLDIFFSLPEWLQKKIKDNLNFDGSELEKALANHKGGGKKKEEKVKKPELEEEPEEEGDNEEVPW